MLYADDYGCAASSFLAITKVANNARLFVCPSSGHKPGALASVDRWTGPRKLISSRSIKACCICYVRPVRVRPRSGKFRPPLRDISCASAGRLLPVPGREIHAVVLPVHALLFPRVDPQGIRGHPAEIKSVVLLQLPNVPDGLVRTEASGQQENQQAENDRKASFFHPLSPFVGNAADTAVGLEYY